jgi:hypothetical protein
MFSRRASAETGTSSYMMSQLRGAGVWWLFGTISPPSRPMSRSIIFQKRISASTTLATRCRSVLFDEVRAPLEQRLRASIRARQRSTIE